MGADTVLPESSSPATEPDPIVPADSAPLIAEPDSLAVTGAEAPTTTGEAEVQSPSIEDRLDRLLENQEALSARLDSALEVQTQTDTLRGIAGSGEVLGEATERVQSFGRGIAWSIVVLILFSLLIRSLVWILDTLAERKPHPQPLLHAAGLMGREPGEAAYIGDADRDIAAGRSAGMMTEAAAYVFIPPGD